MSVVVSIRVDDAQAAADLLVREFGDGIRFAESGAVFHDTDDGWFWPVASIDAADRGSGAR